MAGIDGAEALIDPDDLVAELIETTNLEIRVEDPLWAVDVPAASRSASRYRRAALTALSYGGGRVVTLFSSLIFAPVAFRYLGAERFGIWVTLTAAVGIVGFSDLGIANGLVTAVAQAYAKQDGASLRRSIATAAWLLAAITIGLALLFLAAYWLVPWSSVLNIRAGVNSSGVDAAVATAGVCFLLGLPVVVAEKTQLGLQRGYIGGAWLAMGSLIGLMVAFAGVLLHAGLPVFVAATLGGPAIAGACNCAFWFGGRFRRYRPRRRDVSREAAGALFRVGSTFLALNLTFAVAFLSDPIVVNQVLGPSAAAQFWLPMRLFSVIPAACMLIQTALWPAYGEAIAQLDLGWTLRTLKRSLILGCACSLPVALLLVFAGPQIVRLWAGAGAHPNHLLLVALGVWAVFWILGSIVGTFLMGARVMRLQAICAVVMAVFNLPLSILWAHTIGVSGVVWASVVTYAACVACPYAIAIPRILRRMRGE